MLNVTSEHLSFFILGSYMDVGKLKYLFFVITGLLYAIIIVSNMLLTVVICVNRSLHEPMYIFLCSLFVNELYGSTGLFPMLLMQILSDVHTVSVPLCFLQIFCLYTYVKTEFCNLAFDMAFDRYLAICYPLQYHTLMTHWKVALLISLLWFYSFVSFSITLLLSVRLSLCGNSLHSLYCRNYLIVKLACSDTMVNNILGLFGTAVTVLVPLLPILYSYMKILKVCYFGSRATRQKAANTCTLHLTSLLNFSFACLFEILQSRFDTTDVPAVLQRFMSLYFVILQPLLNPFMFGLHMCKIRNACIELVRKQRL